MVRFLRFSKRRIQKFIVNLKKKEEFELGNLYNLGGSRGQLTGFLKNCKDVEFLGNSKWRKI